MIKNERQPKIRRAECALIVHVYDVDEISWAGAKKNMKQSGVRQKNLTTSIADRIAICVTPPKGSGSGTTVHTRRTTGRSGARSVVRIFLQGN